MKNYLILFNIFIFIFVNQSTLALENWKFVKDAEYCFIQSMPIKTEIPEGKSRGNYGMLVYKMHKNPDLIVQISAGFNYKSVDSISVKIDDSEHEFYTDEDTAWSKNDNEVVYAMKKGLKLVVVGISSKETKVIDTYTLNGFTSAVNKLSSDC